MLITTFNLQTGEVSQRPMTTDEVNQLPAAAEVGVPQSVTRFQALAALHLAGWLPQLRALMADPSTDPLVVLAFDEAQEFRRRSPTVLAMAATLGLADAEIDALFTVAAGIEA